MEWTDWEELKLREMVKSNTSRKDMVEQFKGRTRKSIIGKLNRLGLILPNEKSVPWTKDRLERLKELVADGSTVDDIYEEMGSNRYSVIGALRRIGIKTKEPDKRKPLKPISIPRMPKEKLKLNKELFDTPKPDAITLLDLTQTTCRWPVSDDNKLFCGRHADNTYCAFHSGWAYNGKKYIG